MDHTEERGGDTDAIPKFIHRVMGYRSSWIDVNANPQEFNCKIIGSSLS